MVYAYVARRPYWLYILGTVLFLLEIDGLLLFAILAAALAITERKLPLKPGAIALIITIPCGCYSQHFFGVASTQLLDRFANCRRSYICGSCHPLDAAPAGIQTLAAQFVAGWTQYVLTVVYVRRDLSWYLGT